MAAAPTHREPSRRTGRRRARRARRDDIRPGLRVTGFERRITAAFMIDEPRVVVLRLFYGGRHWGGGGTSAEAD